VTNLVVTAAVIAMTGMNAKATGKIGTNQKGACLPSPWEQVRAPG
jgi:hypothetical protein